MTIHAVVADPSALYDSQFAAIETSPATLSAFLSDAATMVSLSYLLMEMVSEEDTLSSIAGHSQINAVDVTEGNDTLVSTSLLVHIFGSLSENETPDTSHISGTVRIKARVSIAEGNDNFTATSSIPIYAVVADPTALYDTQFAALDISGVSIPSFVADASNVVALANLIIAMVAEEDTLVSNSVHPVRASLAKVENSDTLSSTSKLVHIFGLSGVIENPDIIYAAGKIKLHAISEVIETSDTLTGHVKSPVIAHAILTENDDRTTLTSKLRLHATMISTDNPDFIESVGTLSLYAVIDINEQGDRLFTTTQLTINGYSAITESDDQIYDQTGRYKRIVLNNIYAPNIQ